MKEFLQLLATIVLIVVVPLVILLAIWLGYLPQSVQIGISMIGVFSAIVIIVGGNLYMMWSDIKTKRYSKD